VIGAVGGLALGAALGARHAIEPDHVAAVSTLVADRPRARQAALLGALWGIGHAAAVVVVGIVLLSASAAVPASVTAAAEVVVAGMLIALGVRSLAIAWRGGTGPDAAHRHGAVEHRHPGAARHVHLGDRAVALRPLVVGLIHGLAGSGGLAALAITKMPTTAGAIGYLVAFALGSVLGMAAVSGVAGASLGRLASSTRGRTAVVASSGALSVIVGVAWGAAWVI
jgi:hypothetical protein